MTLSILDRVNYLGGEQKENLKRTGLFILKTLNVPGDKELSVAFVDDEEMRKLNADFRNINRTTDVLSFPQDGPDDTVLRRNYFDRHCLKTLKASEVKH